MLRNYLKTAIGNLLRQGITTSINVISLSVAVGCCILAYLFIDNHVNREWYHKNARNIFLIEHRAVKDLDEVTFGTSPTPLGPALETDIPFIERVVRIARGSAVVQYGDNEFQESVRYVDPGFMEMFTLPLIYGDASALKQKNAVFMSQETARKYFGDENPLGKIIQVSLDGGIQESFTVAAVTEHIPSQSCVEFNFFVNYENRFADSNRMNDWGSFTQATFIQTAPENIDRIAKSMKTYVKLHNTSQDAHRISSFVFENLLDIKRNAGNVQQSIAGRGISFAPIILYGSIAVLLLLLASFNHVNISMASAATRLKEIGIRKVIGGTRRQLIFQFLSENIVLCLMAFVVAIAITAALLLPAFNDITEQGLILDFTLRIDVWVYLLILLIFVGAMSGLYPAFYISSFKPVTILQDKLKFGSKNGFMQGLLAVQFILAFLTMILSVGLAFNVDGLRGRDWGYDNENILAIKVKTHEQYSLMAKSALELPAVRSLAGASQHIGVYQAESKVRVGDVEHHSIIFEVTPSYFETMNLKTVSGRIPQSKNEVMVNETFMKHMENRKFDDIVLDSLRFSVVGVLKDFHHDNFHQDIEPLIFRLGDESQVAYLLVRTDPGAGVQIRDAVAKVWKTNFASLPFNSFFQDQVFDDMYVESRRLTSMFTFTSLLALLMTAVGLYGIASQRVLNKLREICIRKIFGVPLVKALLLVNGGLLVTLAVAALIATPLSYYLLNIVLDNYYTYRMEVGLAPFVVSYGISLLVVALTLARKIYEIVVTNPAKILRSE